MRKQLAGVARIIVGLMAQGFISSTLANPGLTITPAVLTNDYVGTVSFAITGLAVGETVRVEKFVDFNGNGLIDTNDLLVRSFTLTDGQAPLLGGVRNSNVAGDDDGLTNGQITANVFFPSISATADGFSGSYLIRVSDPTNVAFVPIVKPFTVLQKIRPQGVSGTMTAAGSGLPLANAFVALNTQNGNGIIGTITDTNGNYTVYAAPNSYAVICIAPGVVSDTDAGGVTVVTNSFATLNLTNAVATNTISGKVSDSLSGSGLPGLFVQVENATNNLFTGCFTDANGNYNALVTASTWKVKLGESGGDLGYIKASQSQNADTTGGSVSNKNFQMVKATALVYGTVKDTHTNAVPLMRMDGDDQDNVFSAVGQTDNNGNYSIGVIGSTNLNVSPDNNSLAAANLIAQGTNVGITNGQALVVNFVVQQVTAHLIGRLIDSSNNPVGNFNLVVFPFTTNSNFNPGPNLNPSTDGSGNFNIGVFGGSWNLDLEINNAASRNLIGPAPVFNVTDGVDITNITLVAQIGTAQISGTVKDTNGTPLVGVRPFGNATNGGSFYLAGGTTDTNGFYSFEVFPGSWTVGIQGGDLTSRGFQVVPNQPVTISGTNTQVVNFVVQPISAAPNLSQPKVLGGVFQFQLTGLNGRNYRIDASTNLSATNWVAISTNTAFGGSFQFADPNTSLFKRRYYRAFLLP